MLRQQPGQRLTVRHVARRDRDIRTQRGQLSDQFRRAGRVRAAPRHQQQAPHPVLDHQMPGHQTTQHPGRTGHQHRAVSVEHRRRIDSGGHPGQAGRAQGAATDGQFGLARGQRGRQGLAGEVPAIDVQQHQPVGVLPLRGTDQSPDRGVGEVGEAALVSLDRATGHQDQTGRGEPVVRQPPLDDAERAVQRGPDGVGRIGGVGTSAQRQEHRVGDGQTAVDRRAQRGQVGEDRGAASGDGRLVGAQRGPPAGRCGRHRQRDPLHPEQRLHEPASGAAHLAVGDLAGDQRLDHGDRLTGLVGQHQRGGILAALGEPQAQRAGAGGVQGHTVPCERDAGLTGRLSADRPGDVEAESVQRGVQQRRVQTVEGGLLLRGFREAELGIDVAVVTPGGAQALEDRAVAETGGGQALVQVRDVDLDRTGRRPLGQLERRRGVDGGREHAGGVPGPRLLRQCLLQTGVHGQGTAAGSVRRAQGQSQLDATALGQDQRRLQRQLLQHRAADSVTGPHGQFDEGGARQQDRAHHGMVGQPRVRLHRQTAGEHHAVGVGQFDAGPEQRVPGRAEPDRRHVTRRQQRRARPVALALEGVGGEVDALRAGAGVERRPVDGHAAHMGLGEGRGQRADLGALGPQDGRERDVLDGDAVLAERGQHAVRTKLHEGPDALTLQRLDGVAEAHGLVDMPHPVLGRGQVGGLVERRHDRDPRSVERQTRHDSPELVEHRVHQRRVERVAHRQPLGLATLRGQLPGDLQHGLLGTGKHHGGRAVDGRDPHLVGEQRQHLVLGRLHRHHRTARRQRLHQPATHRDQGRRIRKREDTRDVRSRQLADRVTGQEVRRQTPGLHEAEQCDLDREQRRLRVCRLVDPLTREDDVPQWAVQVLVQVCEHLVQRIREHREPLVQLTAHSGPLAALTGEQEGNPAVDSGSVEHVRRGLPRRQRAQSAQQFVPLAGDHHRATLQRRPAGCQREGEAGEFGIPGNRQQSLRLGPQGGRVPAGQHHRQHRRRHGRLDGRHLGGRGRLLQDGVRVGPAEAEGGDADPARRTGLRPLRGLGQQLHRTRRPVDVRRRLLDVQGLRQHAVPHRHDHLDHTGDTRRGLRVPDVGLDRTQPQRLVVGAVAAVGGQEGLRLDRVAEGRAGAVGLDRVDLVGGEACVLQRLADDALLGRPVGGGQTVAGAVLVDSRAADDREDRVAVALRVGQPLDEQHARALAPGGAVGGGGEGLAPAVRRQAALAAEVEEGVGRGHHGDATGEGEFALAVAQGLHRQVQGDQRGGAGGVDGDRRALQPEGVGEAAGQHTGRGAGAEMALQLLGRVHQKREVVLAVGAGEDAGAASAQGRRVDARPLERLPAGLQQQTLLRVHRQRLARRDAEEGRVELGRVVEESALTGVDPADLLRVRVVERVDVPTAVGRQAGHRVAARDEQLPQLLGRGHPAGETAAHRDDGDGLVVRHDRDGGRRRVAGVPAEELGAQVVGERVGRRVVEDQAAGQAEAGRRVEPVAQLDGGQRVEAQLLEGPAGLDPLRAGVGQDGGDGGAHQVQQGAPLLGLGQAGQATGRRGDGGRRLRTGGRSGLRKVVEESAGAPGRHDRQEAVPGDVGDREGAVTVVQCLLEGGDGRLRSHRRDTVAAQALFEGRVGGHAALGPGAPGDGRRGQAVGPALLDERVEVGVGGGVVALAGVADGAGDRGEEHERGQAVGEFVQVARRLHLRTGDGGEALGGQAVHHPVVQHSGRVEDGRHRLVQRREQRGQRVAVSHVARGDGDARTGGGQLVTQFHRAGRVQTPTAGQQQVLGAVADQPTRHLRAQRTGATGDQHRARGLPRGCLATRRAHQATSEDARRADGDLVLAADGGQHTGKAREHAVVHVLREVDETTPALRVLQRHHPAQTPQLGLVRIGRPVGAARRHRAARHAPQGCDDTRVTERLHQRRGEHRLGVRRRQPDHAGDLGGVLRGVTQQVRQGVALPGRTVDLDLPDLDAARGQRPQRGEHSGALARPGRERHHPGARGGTRGGLTHGLPGDAVAPAVHRRLLAALAAPGRQRRQHRAERLVAAQVEGRGKGGEVAAVDGLPEGGVDRVGLRLRRDRHGGRVLQPVPLPLERVGRQVDASRTASGEERRPVHGDAAYVELGERGGQRTVLGTVGAQ